jgi:hypothetical protein
MLRNRQMFRSAVIIRRSQRTTLCIISLSLSSHNYSLSTISNNACISLQIQPQRSFSLSQKLFNKQDAVRGAEMAVREAEMVVIKAQRMLGKWKEENPEFTGLDPKFIILKEEVGSAMEALDSARSYHLSLEGTGIFIILHSSYHIHKIRCSQKPGYLRRSQKLGSFISKNYSK